MTIKPVSAAETRRLRDAYDDAGYDDVRDLFEKIAAVIATVEGEKCLHTMLDELKAAYPLKLKQ